MLNPAFATEHISHLDASSKMSRAYDGTTYLPGELLNLEGQGFMQDENVACHDLGKVSFGRLFRNVPTRTCDSFLNVPIRQLLDMC